MSEMRQQMANEAHHPNAVIVGAILGSFFGLLLSIVLLLLEYPVAVAIGSYVALGVVITLIMSVVNIVRSNTSRDTKLVQAVRNIDDDIRHGILVGQLSGSSATLRVLESIGLKIRVSCGLDTALEAVANETNGLDLIVIDVDNLRLEHSLEVIVARLQKFRSACPKTIVIMLSVSWPRDELGLHRLSIADASLRLPVSKARVIDGFESAILNNIEWRKRVSEGHV